MLSRSKRLCRAISRHDQQAGFTGAVGAYSLEVEVLEVEMNFHNPRCFDPGA